MLGEKKLNYVSCPRFPQVHPAHVVDSHGRIFRTEDGDLAFAPDGTSVVLDIQGAASAMGTAPGILRGILGEDTWCVEFRRTDESSDEWEVLTCGPLGREDAVPADGP